MWAALVKRYIAIQPRLLWPEKPLDKYIGRELEFLVLRWKSVKVSWAMTQLGSESIPRQRHFFVSDEPAPFFSPCHVYLVEGGRWLLIGTRFGAVQYYDLNAITISASTLIPSIFNSCAEIWMSVDLDSAAESFAFYLGILTRRRPDNLAGSPHHPHNARWIQIWRVTAKVESNDVTGLNSELQCSFCEEYEPACFAFRLRGQLVSYSLFYSHLQVGPINNGHKIIIVDWKSSDLIGLNYPRKIISDIKASVSSVAQVSLFMPNKM